MQQIAFDKVRTILDQIDAETVGIAALESAARSTNLRRSHLVLGGAVFVFAFLFIGFGANFFSNLLGIVYPAYASFKAIESKDTRDDTQWFVT